jgi:hypothetical protein
MQLSRLGSSLISISYPNVRLAASQRQ